MFRNKEIAEIQENITSLMNDIKAIKSALGGIDRVLNDPFMLSIYPFSSSAYKSRDIAKLEERLSLLEKYLSISIKTTPESKKYVGVKK